MKSVCRCLLALLLSIGTTSVDADDVSGEVSRLLEELPNNWPEAKLRVWLNEGDADTVMVGERIQLNIQAEVSGYPSILHVTSDGSVEVIIPRCGGENEVLQPAVVCSYPGEEEQLVAELPASAGSMHVVISAAPIDRTALGKASPSVPSTYVSMDDPLDLAKRFRAATRHASRSGLVSVASVRYQVQEAASDTQYTVRGIVDYFSEQREVKTRSISRPSLPANIEFELDAATLTEQAKRDLEVWGEALTDPALNDAKFVVAGHTDDIGTDAYNLELSRRRAKAVQSYLVSGFNIRPERLTVKAFGESRPLSTEKTEAARRQNRRVEFEYVP